MDFCPKTFTIITFHNDNPPTYHLHPAHLPTTSLADKHLQSTQHISQPEPSQGKSRLSCVQDGSPFTEQNNASMCAVNIYSAGCNDKMLLIHQHNGILIDLRNKFTTVRMHLHLYSILVHNSQCVVRLLVQIIGQLID